MSISTVTIVILCMSTLACCKVFTRCELAKELFVQGIPIKQLPDWVCLVESESNRDTKAIGGPNWDGSYDWGLFQINDRYWCVNGTDGGSCNLNCDALLTDNIKIATRCAKKIYRIHGGFHAWVGWKNKCQGSLPNLSSCGLN